MKLKLTLLSKKNIMGGMWCIDGTRIPIERVFWLLKFGGLKELYKEYPQLKKGK